MGCYKCGKDGGTEVRLCPDCNQEKRATLKAGVKMIDEDSEEARLSRRKHQAGMFAALCGTLSVSLFILLFAPFGPMYGYSVGERAYARCMQKANSEIASKAPPASDALGKEMQKALESIAAGVVTKTCDLIKTECDKDPNGRFCQAGLNF